jgi:hypothetical protein
MRKLTAIVLVAVLVVPLLAGPAQAWVRGGGWGGHGGWHGGGYGWGGFALGLGIGALATSPYWYPPAYAYPAYPYGYPAYPYPAYAYPTYPYPAYSYPTYSPPVYASPPVPGAGGQADPSASLNYGSPPANPPQASAEGSAPSGGQNCETVTVQGHYETRTLQNGQRVTAWIPAYSQQICQ